MNDDNDLNILTRLFLEGVVFSSSLENSEDGRCLVLAGVAFSLELGGRRGVAFADLWLRDSFALLVYSRTYSGFLASFGNSTPCFRSSVLSWAIVSFDASRTAEDILKIIFI